MGVRIGCSGWSYAHWREPVYGGAPPARWLELYAARFDTVEVNATFYRLPTRRAVEGWVGRTPPGVRFHHGSRGRRGTYSETELRAWARWLAGLEVPAWAYFNNDWEAFAVRNAERLRALLA